MDEQTLLSRYATGDRRFPLARLSNRNLPGVNLAGADLTAAIMPGVNLRGADLTGADLRDATVTVKQLALAKSLQGATMPDGTKHV